MKEVQQLRCIALKISVSGSVLPISQTRLYKGSYGFVKLQVYAPKTQNTESPICTAFCTTTDELGRVKISSRNYNLMYVGESNLDGKVYSLFESYLPKEFTKESTTPNGLKITFNYFDTEIAVDEFGEVIFDNNGVPKRNATDLLVSGVYTTTVYPGGWNNEDIALGINSAEVAQIVENMRNIADIQNQIGDIEEIANGTHADSSEALNIASQAKDIASAAEQKVDTAIQDVATHKAEVATKIDDLEALIAEGQGTIVEVDGKELAKVHLKDEPQKQFDALELSDEEIRARLDDLAIESATANEDINRQLEALRARLSIELSITIPKNEWDEFNNTATVTVEEVDTDSKLIVSPTDDSAAMYVACGILAVAQAKKEIIFTCTTIPLEDITVQIIIL